MADVNVDNEYDDENYTIIREAHLNAVQSPAASLTDFAHFRCRNKCIVTHVTVSMTSLPSSNTAWSLQVMRNGATTLAFHLATSFSVNATVASLQQVEFTLTTLNTLVSVGNYISLELDSTEKGKFDVVYQYQYIL